MHRVVLPLFPNLLADLAAHLVASKFSLRGLVQPRLGCNGLLQTYVKSKTPPTTAIEELFIRCLSRKPTSDELAGLQKLTPESPANTQPYEDLVWALLNSTEFMFNH